MQTQLASLRHRLNSSLDYFFNPAGWTPELSLQANLEAYRQEVASAVGTLFVAFWVENTTNKDIAAANAIDNSIAMLEKQRKDAIGLFDSAEQRAARLNGLQQDIASKIGIAMTQLKQVDDALRAEAEHIVSELHALNAVLKAFTLLASVIPVGQPELGFAGKFLDSLNTIDGTTPPDFAQTGEPLKELLGSFLNSDLAGEAAGLKSTASETVDSDGTQTAESAKEHAERMNKIAGNAADALTGFASSLFHLSAPKDEVEAKLQELEANNALYQELAHTLRDLNSQKRSSRRNSLWRFRKSRMQRAPSPTLCSQPAACLPRKNSSSPGSAIRGFCSCGKWGVLLSAVSANISTI